VGTAQSVVARIEGGQASPSFATLSKMLEAAGFDLVTQIDPRLTLDRSELDDVRRILKLTPEERLNEVRNVSRFVAAARRV
jgi:predicted transcriptional regulator